jgi:hypothetical protein
MAPTLGKRPREGEGHGSSETCVHGRGQGGYFSCKECPGKGICEHGRQRNKCKECGGGAFCEHGRRKHSCKECRAARDQAAPVLCPPAEPPPAILVEFEDVEDPGEDDDERT